MNITSAVRKIVPSYGLPDASAMLHQSMALTKFTPDIDILEGYEWQLVFVADELKKDHAKHHLMGVEAKYNFPAFTQKSFTYWTGPPWDSPIPMRAEHDSILSRIVGMPPVAKIKGEIYSIRPRSFIDLDTYKENTVQFQRERVRLVVPYRKLLWLRDKDLDPLFKVQQALGQAALTKSIMHTPETTCIIKAWMYIGRPAFWDPLLTTYEYSAVESHHSNTRRWCETYYNIRRPQLKAK